MKVLAVGVPRDYERASRTHELRTSARVDRLARSVGVLVVTLLATTMAKAPRPDDS